MITVLIIRFYNKLRIITAEYSIIIKQVSGVLSDFLADISNVSTERRWCYEGFMAEYLPDLRRYRCAISISSPMA